MEAHQPSFDQLRNNAAECIRLAEAACTSAHKSVVERAGSDQSHGRIKAWRFGVASAQIMWPPARGRSL
jgi:hypothetical protein